MPKEGEIPPSTASPVQDEAETDSELFVAEQINNSNVESQAQGGVEVLFFSLYYAHVIHK